MSRLQPVGQKRLTNICIVRLKRHGKRFEVAAYRNTVIAWRNKVETDIDEVLQVHTIYSNLDKGILAKSEDLIEAFGTDDEDKVCVEVLNKGEFQVSEQERQMQVDALFKDVATKVADMCINPTDGRPYPLSTIERAMRETLHFKPATTRSAKQQALQVVKQLEASSVLPIARAKMRLRLVAPSGQQDAVLAEMNKIASSSDSDERQEGTERLLIGSVDRAAAIAVGADSGSSAGGDQVSIAFHADPNLFRPLSELAKRVGGTLQVIELKATSAGGTQAGDGAGAAAADGGAAAAAATAAAAAAANAAAANAANANANAAAMSTEASSRAAGRSARADGPASDARGGAAAGGRAAVGGAAAGGRAAAGGAADKRAERMFKLNLRNAENGDPVAQLEVGKAYLEGKGVEADEAKGREYLRQAAQQGVKQATSRLEALEIS